MTETISNGLVKFGQTARTARHADGAIVSTDAIQMSIKCGNTAATSSACHRWYGHPASNAWIKFLHRRLIIAGIKATESKNAIIDDGQTAIATLSWHRWAWRPYARQCVVSFNAWKTASTVIATANPNQLIKRAYSQTWSFRSHGCYVLPSIRPWIVAFGCREIGYTIISETMQRNKKKYKIIRFDSIPFDLINWYVCVVSTIELACIMYVPTNHI